MPDYMKELDKLYNELAKEKVMVLATSAGNRVTARNMSVVCVNGSIYFQTDSNMTKIRQIKKNNNVALCVGNIQIEGKAELIKSWDDIPDILEEYKKYHEDAYEKYKVVAAEVIVKVLPKFVEKWEYINGKPYIYTLDTEKKTVLLEEYELK